jgi:hypothetical protein
MESTDRSIAAEARGVEENHHARLGHDQDGIYVRVASDSVPGRWYRVTAHATAGQDGDITFTCKPNDLHQHGRRRDHGLKCSNDGTTPCKHMTRAARRLERAGLIRWVDPHVDQDIVYPGRWVAARATSPIVADDLAATEAPAVSGPVEDVAEWLTVPAVTAAGMGIRSPWVEAMTTRRVAPADRVEVRRIPGERLVTAAEARRFAAEAPRVASDSQGYRATMAAIAPTTGDPFAGFPRY